MHMLTRMDFSKLAERLRDARERRGLFRSQVVDGLDIHETTLWRWENGKAVPSLHHLHEVSRRLGVRLAWLAEGEEPMDPSAGDEAA